MNPEPFLKNGTLVWTLTTNGYKFITLNLIRSIERHKVGWRPVVVAGDKDSYVFFRREGIATLLYPKAEHTREMQITKWGTEQFSKYNFIKLYVLNEFAKNPAVKKCIYMDGDIVVFRDFVPDLEARLEANPETILIQCDEKGQGPCDLSGNGYCWNCCTGFIAWSHGADKGMFAVPNQAAWKERPDDQVWVNHQLRTQGIAHKTLERELYPNGAYITSIRDLKEPFLLHFNWRVGQAKINDMKRLGEWLVPY